MRRALVLVPLLLAPLAQADSRLVLPFNSNWTFFRGELLPEQMPPAGKGWRNVALPHDFAIEDLPPETPAPEAIDTLKGPWKFQQGDDPSWKTPTFDDKGWKGVNLPAEWWTHGDGKERAYGWYRKRLSVAPNLKGKPVVLGVGRIDDVDQTYLNGVLIGASGKFPPNYATAYAKPRFYKVPAGLLKADGTDVLAVRVYNDDGTGGITSGAGKGIRSGPFDSNAQDGLTTGFTSPGIGWYRREWVAPQAWAGKVVLLKFDGVYMRTTVWVNGKVVRTHPYGYTPFTVDLSSALKYGKANTIALRVDATPPNSRWYTGSGIYRPVRLEVRNKAHIISETQFVRTIRTRNGELAVESTQQVTPGAKGLVIRGTLVDPSGKAVDARQQPAEAETLTFSVPDPALWSPDSPKLYTLTLRLIGPNGELDSVSRKVGIRTFQWVPQQGLFLNGKPIDLKGGCVHHDNGPLGAVSLPDAEFRRVRILKSLGYNAIRTAHNPPSEALLDACDRLGMLILSEIFDNWKRPKGSNYNEFFDTWWAKDVEAWLHRDRNHPSVIAYSIGNEIPEQSDDSGLQIGRMLADKIRQIDDSRPVTMASFPIGDGWRAMDRLYAHLDIAGYNYMAQVFPAILKEHPERLIFHTESQSPNMFHDLMQMRDLPAVVGDYVWAAWDYIGEVGVGRVIRPGEPDGFFGQWPFVTTGSGEIDMIGNPKPQAIYRKVLFGVPNTIGLFAEPSPRNYKISLWGWADEKASWNWPGLHGKPMTLRVYSSTPKVKLLLNGRDLGTRETNRNTKFTATWNIPYAPGRLVALGLDASGKETCRSVLATAGAPAKLGLKLSKGLDASDQSLAFVDIDVLDAQNNVCATSDLQLNFALEGPAALAAVGNGNPRSMESFQQPKRSAWQGRAQAILRATGDKGTVKLTVSGKGVATSTIILPVR